MTNVSHASLTGASLHEPKGIETASSGQAYLADGVGSGSWTALSGISFTGLVADFLTPIAPSGWLELDGSTLSTTTYASLYSAVTIQRTGNRINGANTITGLSTIAHLKVGYYVFGAGISSGTTLTSIDSPTQISMSANASSSGSSTVIFSPWLIASGTFTLPNTLISGLYRRSRTNSTIIGAIQTSQNKSHTHTFTTSTDTLSGVVVTSGNPSADHTHSYTGIGSSSVTPGGTSIATVGGLTSTSGTSAPHTHNVTMPGHTHTGTVDSDGSSEARPSTLILMTCVKI